METYAVAYIVWPWNWRNSKPFMAVIREGSFSAAAKALYRTQPAISQTIKKLEDEVGRPLFDRASRRGLLTDAGRVLAVHAERLLNFRQQALSALDDVRQLRSGRLTLAANELTCLYLLPLLNEFRRLYPSVHVTVQRALASRIPGQVLDYGADIGIVTFRPDLELLTSIVVYRDELAFVVPPGHQYAKRPKVSIEELAGESFVAHHVASPYRNRVIETFQDKRIQLQMPVELPTIDAIKKFVAMGNGVALAAGDRGGRRDRAQGAGPREGARPRVRAQAAARVSPRGHALPCGPGVSRRDRGANRGSQRKVCLHHRALGILTLSCPRAKARMGRSRAAKLAEVAELADALASGASPGNRVEVRVLSSAPNISHETNHCVRPGRRRCWR